MFQLLLLLLLRADYEADISRPYVNIHHRRMS